MQTDAAVVVRAQVRLGQSAVTPAGFKALAEGLCVSPTFESLFMDGTTLMPVGGIIAGITLQQKTCGLKKLSLTMCGLGDEGAKAIAGALKTNTTLTDLDLSSNGIENDGQLALAEAVRQNATLQVLTMTYTNWGDARSTLEEASAASNKLPARKEPLKCAF